MNTVQKIMTQEKHVIQTPVMSEQHNVIVIDVLYTYGNSKINIKE